MARVIAVLCVALVAVALAEAQRAAYGAQGLGFDQGQMQGGYGGQPGALRSAGGFGGQATQGRFGAQQQGFARQEDSGEKYRSRIFTEPDYDGYEANYPGGRASFKSYKGGASGAYRQGAAGAPRGLDDGTARGRGGIGGGIGSGSGARGSQYGGFQYGGGQAERF